jgi:hypothetical protein
MDMSVFFDALCTAFTIPDDKGSKFHRKFVNLYETTLRNVL